MSNQDSPSGNGLALLPEVPVQDTVNNSEYNANQITVLESTVRAVDAASASQGDLMGGQYQYGYVGGLGMGMDPSIGVSHQLYRYGPDAVVELDLVCEYLFDRPGYESLLPDAVKKVLDSAAAQATPVM